MRGSGSVEYGTKACPPAANSSASFIACLPSL
jgi:hypothetical protein